jgi:hypothetical protein
MIAGQNVSRATCLELWGPLVQVVKHIGLQLAIVLHMSCLSFCCPSHCLINSCFGLLHVVVHELR